MKILMTIILLAISMLTSCSASDKKSAELYDTAAFEEKQNNFEHAIKLYDEILEKHPKSPVAKKVSERLVILKQRKP